MKVNKYSLGAVLFSAAVAFGVLHLVNGSGTAADGSKPATERITELKEELKANPGVGTVVMWWGSRDAIPAGWEICNGQKAQTAGATLSSNKPNLIDRFPKGATSSRKSIDDLSQGVGGSNNMPALQISKIDGLKISEDGEHSHSSVNLAAAGKDTIEQAAGDDAQEINVTRTVKTSKAADDSKNSANSEGRHSHQLNGFLGTEGGINADGDDKTGANQPAYAELFFIIKVK